MLFFIKQLSPSVFLRAQSLVPLKFFSLMASLMLVVIAHANDGRDRYQQGYPNLLEHFNDVDSKEAGLRVLAEDMQGGADGDPAFRWAQAHALALVEVAARHTQQALGASPYPMAMFDCSAENGDTPIDFFWRAQDPSPPPPPRGRHPGGSHDGGLNLDLGYYLTSLKGQHDDEDYAACSDHFSPTISGPDGKPQDLQQCAGPADRLDVARQAFFVLELLKINRDRFGLGLLDEGGMDARVQAAVMAQLKSWLTAKKYAVTRAYLEDLKRLFSHDAWGGWARYHHHHLHLRLLATSRQGALLGPSQALISEARFIRAGLLAQAHPDWPMAFDVRLLSYKLERAVSMHLLPLRERPGFRLAQVRYRINQGKWEKPPQLDDGAAWVIDLKPGLLRNAEHASVAAELTDTKGKKVLLQRVLSLPRLDPRLFAQYIPGQVHGQATLRKSKIQASLDIPPQLAPLVTEVRYLLYPFGQAQSPEVHALLAPGYTRPSKIPAPAQKSRATAKDLTFSLRLKRDVKAPTISLISAQLILSGRMAVDVPLLIQAPKP